jgi:N-methylhydantoinase A
VSTQRVWRIGVDIGGTFTDGILWNEVTGQRAVVKVLSTPDDLSRGFLAVVRHLLRENHVRAEDVAYLAHGTTVATNAVLERQLAPTGYVTTAGFRDVFEIARQVRPNPYDVFTEKPVPLVPRNLCLEVRERITAEGTVLVPLAEEDVDRVAEILADANVAAAAVCLLHAYANPEHELRVGELLSKRLPDLVVTLSSVLAPEFREYPRACTAAINAGLVPIAANYLRRIEEHLAAEGLTAELRVMQSNGGVLPFAQARETPIRILESGPAAGVMGAVHLGELRNDRNLISFDMGGTTAKVGLIRDGQPRMSQDFEVGAQAQSRDWFTGAQGYPILTPSVDLVEIGAGGGSIAWVDTGGKLRVGPRSAGAEPGPACYGLGGTEATVTDANVVLGRLDPARPLGDEIELDAAAAERTVAAIGRRLGLDMVEAALGVVDIANAAMVRALRMVSVQRGYDPREFALVAFGGAGPLHAVALAEEMQMPQIVVQPQPGIASALGLLVTDLKLEYSTTWIRSTCGVEAEELQQVFEALKEQGRNALTQDLVDVQETELRCFLDLRYEGQSYQLVVAVRDELPTGQALRDAITRFHELHELTYGYSEPSEPTEIVTVRVSAIGLLSKPAAMTSWADNDRGLAGTRQSRPVCFRGHGFVDTPVFERSALPPGWSTAGPAMVEGRDSTVLIHPGWTAAVSSDLSLGLMATDGR